MNGIDITDGTFRVLKITAILGIGALFLIGINALISMISVVVFGNVVGEVMGIVSCCLPFNAAAVFGAVSLALSGILSFMIVRKIFDLTSWSINSI